VSDDLVKELRWIQKSKAVYDVRKECGEAADRIEEQETIVNYVIGSQTHLCSGRDCVGFRQPLTGSLYRCDRCEGLMGLLEYE